MGHFSARVWDGLCFVERLVRQMDVLIPALS